MANFSNSDKFEYYLLLQSNLNSHYTILMDKPKSCLKLDHYIIWTIAFTEDLELLTSWKMKLEAKKCFPGDCKNQLL